MAHLARAALLVNAVPEARFAPAERSLLADLAGFVASVIVVHLVFG